VGLAVTYASHELVFMNTAILVGWLALMFLAEFLFLPDHVKDRLSRVIARRKKEIQEQVQPEKPPVSTVVTTASDDPDELDELVVIENKAPEVTQVAELSEENDTNPEEEPAPQNFWLAFFSFNRKGLYAFGYTFMGVLLLATLVSLRFAMTPRQPGQPNNGIPRGNLLLVGPEVDKWVAYVFNGAILALLLGLVAGWLVSLADLIDDRHLGGSAGIRGVLRIFRQPWAIAAFFIGFAVIYIPLFGNFFTYIPGLADGIYRGVEYWAGVHNTRRLDQPWFYYPMLMLLYETLPFLLALAALIIVPIAWVERSGRKSHFVFSLKGMFAGYCLWWFTLALLAYSVAGEKVPWLNMQVALPAILAAAILAERVVRRIDWRRVIKPTGGVLFGSLFIIIFACVAVIIGQLISIGELGKSVQPPAGSTIESTRTYQLLETLITAVVGVSLLGVTVWLWRTRRVAGYTMRAVIFILFVVVLGAYGIKSSVLANYVHPDVAVEPLVQVQTAPDIVLFVQRLERLARDVRDTYRITPPTPGSTTLAPDPAGAKGLPILVSNEVAWKLVWYLRSYTNVGYFKPNTEATSNTDIIPLKDSRGNPYAVIAMQASEDQSRVQEALRGQYTRYQIRFRWWFPEDDGGYGSIGKAPPGSATPDREKKAIQNTDWGKLWRTFTTQPSASQMWRYIMYRELATTPGAVDMVYYIRNELEPDLPLASGMETPISETPASNVSGYSDLAGGQVAGNRDGQFRLPRGVALAANGDLLVLDSQNGRVQRFSSAGSFISKFGSPGTGDGQFSLISLSTGKIVSSEQSDGGPGGITVDEEGNIYVSDTWGYRIQKFDANGNFLLKWGEGLDVKNDPSLAQRRPDGFYGPRGLFYDKDKKELYVADTGNRRIVVFDKNGTALRQFGSSGSGPGQFNEPTGVAVSTDGIVYVTDLRNKRVQVLDRNGAFLNEISIPELREQAFSEPFVTLDGTGTVYVSNPAGGQILRFSPDGSRLPVLSAQSRLVNPTGLVVGNDGALYVVDTKRHGLVKILLF
jgi:sugar lactone lactonase YvrE